MYKFSNKLLPDVFDISSTNSLMFANIIPEMQPHNMCIYVSKEQTVDKKL